MLAGKVAQVEVVLEEAAVVLNKDGSVSVISDNNVSAYIEEVTKSWQGIVKLESSGRHIAAVKGNGTVLSNLFDTENWRNIEKITLTEECIVGITFDGDVIAAGMWGLGCDPTGLSNIDNVYIHENAVYAITKDGKVIQRNYGYIDPVIDTWTGVKKLSFYSNQIAAVIPEQHEPVTHPKENIYVVNSDAQLFWDWSEEGNYPFFIKEGRFVSCADESAKGNTGYKLRSGVLDAKAYCELYVGRTPDEIVIHEDGTITSWHKETWYGEEKEYWEWTNLREIFAVRCDNVVKVYGVQNDGSVLICDYDNRGEKTRCHNWNVICTYRGEGGVVMLTEDGKFIGDGIFSSLNQP